MTQKVSAAPNLIITVLSWDPELPPNKRPTSEFVQRRFRLVGLIDNKTLVLMQYLF